MGSWCIPEFMCFTLLRLRALYYFPALLSLFIRDSSSYFFFWFSKFPFSCPVLSSLISSCCVPQVFPLPLWPSCVYMLSLPLSFVVISLIPPAVRPVLCVCVSHIISQFNTFFYNPACHMTGQGVTSGPDAYVTEALRSPVLFNQTSTIWIWQLSSHFCSCF